MLNQKSIEKRREKLRKSIRGSKRFIHLSQVIRGARLIYELDDIQKSLNFECESLGDCYKAVFLLFEKDHKKASAFFFLDNANFGCSPLELFFLGRQKIIINFIREAVPDL